MHHHAVTIVIQIRSVSPRRLCFHPALTIDRYGAAWYSSLTMVSDNGDTPQKLWFPNRLRELRLAAGKKQREVGVAIGMLERSYANVETSNFKRMRLDRVHRLAKFYGLDNADTNALVSGWEALPPSPYNQRMAKPWAVRKETKSKLKSYDRMRDVLAGLTALLIATHPDPGTLCNCSFDGSTVCELCDALRELGLHGWTTSEQVMKELAALQDKLGDTGKDTNGQTGTSQS